VHHADAAQAVLRALQADGVDGEAFNVADDAPATAYELLELNDEEPADGAAAMRLDDPWEGHPRHRQGPPGAGLPADPPTVYAARDAGAL
jgi:nucleoside-diphosphate-sugar epimerase